MKRSSLMFAVAALLATVTAASADGMNTYTPVEADRCSGGRFSGAYIGASVGYAELDADQFNPTADPAGIGGSDDGFTAGIHSGYNVQCDRVVFGIESDIHFANLDADSVWPDDLVYASSQIDWFSTLRGRLGVVVSDRALLYVTGGLAYVDLEHIISDPANDFYDSRDNFEVGWTVGGGIELACSDNWSLRAEGLYVDLGDKSEHYVLDPNNGCGGGAGTCEADVRWDDSFWVGRVALSYRFGAREEPVPLK